VTPALWVAVIGVVGVLLGGGLVGAILTYRRGTRADQQQAKSDLVDDLAARLAHVESRLSDMEVKYSSLWAYCRRLIDYAFRWRRDDAPDVPDMPKELT
jgi:hypothetical protein